jgi:hypothetical protein
MVGLKFVLKPIQSSAKIVGTAAVTLPSNIKRGAGVLSKAWDGPEAAAYAAAKRSKRAKRNAAHSDASEFKGKAADSDASELYGYKKWVADGRRVKSIMPGLLRACKRNYKTCALLTASAVVVPIVLQNMTECGELLPIPNACEGADGDKAPDSFDQTCVSDFSACYGACLPQNFDPLQSANAQTPVYRTRESYANELVSRCSTQPDCTLTNEEVATMVTDSTEGLLYAQPFCGADRNEETCEGYCLGACRATLVSYEQLYQQELAGENAYDCTECTCTDGGPYDTGDDAGAPAGDSAASDESWMEKAGSSPYILIAVVLVLVAAVAVYYFRTPAKAPLSEEEELMMQIVS